MYCLNFRETILSFSVLLRFYRIQKLFSGQHISNSYTTEDKSLVLAKTKSMKKSKHSNRTVNLQAFVKTAIKWYTIYPALKLKYHPALLYSKNSWDHTFVASYEPWISFHEFFDAMTRFRKVFMQTQKGYCKYP